MKRHSKISWLQRSDSDALNMIRKAHTIRYIVAAFDSGKADHLKIHLR